MSLFHKHSYPDEFELYNLQSDNPTEYNNLAYDPQYAETREKMETLLHEVSRQKLLIQPEPFDEVAFAEWYVGQH